jgi:hypothetical protein
VALPGTGRNSFSDVGEDLAIDMTRPATHIVAAHRFLSSTHKDCLAMFARRAPDGTARAKGNRHA